MNEIIAIAVSAIAFLLSISCHEFAHGYTAYRLGDPTAKNAGRLTLNPLKHFDFISILFFLVFHFGWAKGVPIDARYFKNQKRGMVYTALAGPATNVLLAFLSALVMLFLPDTMMISPWGIYVYYFFYYMVSVNTMLAIFNLLPIPPLDGSKIFYSVFPDSTYYRILSYDRYMLIVLLILVYTGMLNTIIINGSTNLQNLLFRAAKFLIGGFNGSATI